MVIEVTNKTKTRKEKGKTIMALLRRRIGHKGSKGNMKVRNVLSAVECVRFFLFVRVDPEPLRKMPTKTSAWTLFCIRERYFLRI